MRLLFSGAVVSHASPTRTGPIRIATVTLPDLVKQSAMELLTGNRTALWLSPFEDRDVHVEGGDDTYTLTCRTVFGMCPARACPRRRVNTQSV